VVDSDHGSIHFGLLDYTHDQRVKRPKRNAGERVRQMDKKVEQLFVLWNKHIDRLLDEARRGKK